MGLQFGLVPHAGQGSFTMLRSRDRATLAINPFTPDAPPVGQNGVSIITGADEATLTRQAERLADLAKAAPTTPKPDRTQGGSGEPAALNSDALENSLRSKLGIA